MGTGSNREVLALWIGPGARLAELRPFLAAALPGEELNDLDDFIELPARESILLVDGDALRSEDCTDLARFVARSASSRVLVVADDPSRRGVRALLRSDRVRWIPWPPDVDDLRSIADLARSDGAEPIVAITPRPRAAAPTSPRSFDRRAAESAAAGGARDRSRSGSSSTGAPSALTREIEEIERVLGADAIDEDAAPGRPAVRDAGDARDASRELGARNAHAAPRSTPAPAAPTANGESARERSENAEAFRAQVADLADIAQRLELTLEGARSDGDSADQASGAALDAVAREVARLVQFARTLGYLVAPPARGAQRFDLTEMIEVFLSDIRSSGPDAPRCLLRSNGPLPVLSDRRLLGQAFDALFFLARSAATRGEVLRVQALRDDSALPPAARVTIEFPADSLASIAPEVIVAPYGLRRVFPDLGPNALTAAARIIEGQGGRCRLGPSGDARLEWSVTLPLASDAEGADERGKASASTSISSSGANGESFHSVEGDDTTG